MAPPPRDPELEGLAILVVILTTAFISLYVAILRTFSLGLITLWLAVPICWVLAGVAVVTWWMGGRWR